jgi:hypothetical protein
MSPEEVFFALDFGDPDPAVIDVMERLLEENDQQSPRRPWPENSLFSLLLPSNLTRIELIHSPAARFCHDSA